MLSQVAADHDEAVFLFASQGETPAQVERYLAQQGLAFEHVLIDTRAELGDFARSPGLPTTLFFNPDGELVGTHLGEISRGRVLDGVRAIQP